jgi:low temperature requirement protein LtrA
MRPLIASPRLRTATERDDERHATWLELFFDLVFVVAVAQLGHNLEDDHSLGGILAFVGLFVPVWWAWIGFTFYADRFDTDDVLHRAAMLGGMLAVGALAVTVSDTPHGGSAAFAIAYVVVRAIVIALYGRAWRGAPEARPLVGRYVTGFSVGAAVWLLSVAVPEPWRFVLWAVALAIEIGTPIASMHLFQRIPIHRSHIPERLGLFTIIVFGESVFAVVTGVADASWGAAAVAAAMLGFVCAGSLWWIYFDLLDGAPVRYRGLYGQTFVNTHLLLVVALTAVGIGTLETILHAGDSRLDPGVRAALFGGAGTFLLCLSLIHAVATDLPGGRVLAARTATGIFAIALAVAGGFVAPLVVLALLAGALLLQLAIELVALPPAPEAEPRTPVATATAA